MTMYQRYRNLRISDDLHRRIRIAIAQETIRTGDTPTISAWIREAIAQRLEREEERAA